MTLLMNTDKSTPLIDEYPLGTTQLGVNCAAVPRMTKPAPCRRKGVGTVATVAHAVDFEGGFRSGHRKGGAACLVSEHIWIGHWDSGAQIL